MRMKVDWRRCARRVPCTHEMGLVLALRTRYGKDCLWIVSNGVVLDQQALNTYKIHTIHINPTTTRSVQKLSQSSWEGMGVQGHIFLGYPTQSQRHHHHARESPSRYQTPYVMHPGAPPSSRMPRAPEVCGECRTAGEMQRSVFEVPFDMRPSSGWGSSRRRSMSWATSTRG